MGMVTERRRTSPVILTASVTVWTLMLCIGGIDGSMDISAFEYFHKFGRHLELGECPQRELLVTVPDNSTYILPQACNARQSGNVTSLPRELNDTRHVIIPSANDLVAYLGLCGGEAASYLGILNNAGDCVAVDIASRLSFTPHTLVTAYVEYYRQSIDILDTPNDVIDNVREGYSQYVSDMFYVKHRSYGTLEVILVQFSFRSRKETEMAKLLKKASPSLVMSEYMKQVEREVGRPRRVMAISLSTSTDDTYDLQKYVEGRWGSAVRDVELRELAIQQRRPLIASGRIRPHLNYQLVPFLAKDVLSYRMSSPLTWEALSMLEVSLRVSIRIAKKSEKLCRKDRSRLCRRVRELRRQLKSLQTQLHTGRSQWLTLSSKQQQELAIRHTARVASYGSVTNTLAQQVRREKKKQRKDKLAVKKLKTKEERLTLNRGEKEERLAQNKVELEGRLGRVKLRKGNNKERLTLNRGEEEERLAQNKEELDGRLGRVKLRKGRKKERLRAKKGGKKRLRLKGKKGVERQRVKGPHMLERLRSKKAGKVHGRKSERKQESRAQEQTPKIRHLHRKKEGAPHEHRHKDGVRSARRKKDKARWHV